MKDERELKPYDLALAGFSAIRQIDQTDAWQDEALASAFLCAAWPSLRAQNQ